MIDISTLVQMQLELEDTSEILPHLTGAIETGFAKAKRLAIEAGLIEPEEPKVTQLIDWFRQSCAPLLDRKRQEWLEHDAQQDIKDQENYYDSRAARYRHNRQIEYLRRGDSNDHGMGLYEWSIAGKSYRSWLGNEPLATPRQIAGKLLAKHPGNEVVVLLEGFTTTNCAGASLVGGIGVPKYRAYLTPKLPNVLLTAERLYLDHGRVLDMEDATRIEREYSAGLISRELYADAIAKLCRDAPVDEGFNDYRCGIWEELDPKTHEIKQFETDDTRDDYSHAIVQGMSDYGQKGYYVSTFCFNGKVIKPSAYEWEEEEQRNQSDMDNSIDVSVLLGLSTQQIEDTFENIGSDATISEFFANLVPKQAAVAKVDALFNRGEVISF